MREWMQKEEEMVRRLTLKNAELQAERSALLGSLSIRW
jgi:hypothetical protein